MQIGNYGESCLHIKGIAILPEMGHMQTQLSNSPFAFYKLYTVKTPYGQYIIFS